MVDHLIMIIAPFSSLDDADHKKKKNINVFSLTFSAFGLWMLSIKTLLDY
jgi:hypothetical protein